MSTKVILLLLLLVVVVVELCPSPGLVEAFDDPTATAALAALDPLTRSKVTAIGDALYNNLVLYRDKHIYDCNTYALLYNMIKTSSQQNGLTAPQSEAVFYYVLQKDPGFFSGFNLGRCMQGAPIFTSSTGPQPASTAPQPTYSVGRMSIGGQNQCLTVLGGNHTSGTPIVQTPCSPTDPNQALLGIRTTMQSEISQLYLFSAGFTEASQNC